MAAGQRSQGVKAPVHNLKIRLDAIRRRIRLGREALATGSNVDLSALSGEVQDASEALHAAPLHVDREAVVQDLEAIITDLDSLERELSAHYAIIGGKTIPDDGADD